MKRYVLLVFTILVIGCNSSSDVTAPDTGDSALAGTWVSNCHEFLGTEDESGNNRFNISTITFTESEYVDNYISYSDMSCTVDPVAESNAFRYTVGGLVPTSDGVKASRISITVITPERPDLEFVFEAIFRITGIDLNFGEYADGEVPSIDIGL